MKEELLKQHQIMQQIFESVYMSYLWLTENNSQLAEKYKTEFVDLATERLRQSVLVLTKVSCEERLKELESKSLTG